MSAFLACANMILANLWPYTRGLSVNFSVFHYSLTSYFCFIFFKHNQSNKFYLDYVKKPFHQMTEKEFEEFVAWQKNQDRVDPYQRRIIRVNGRTHHVRARKSEWEAAEKGINRSLHYHFAKESRRDTNDLFL